MTPELQLLHDAMGMGDATPARDQRSIARALGGMLLQKLGRHAPYANRVTLGGRSIALYEFGTEMMDALWPEGESSPDREALHARIDAISDPAAQRTCCDMLARLGHMHQMAGLLLRDLELEAATTPTTAQAFLDGNFGRQGGLPYTQVRDAVEALSKPHIELTFTAHPTNTNGLSSMIAQRAIATALHHWRKGGPAEDVDAAFQQYANAPLLPERTNAPPGLSVRDEVQTMLYFLNNAYDDLDRVYAGYDRALSARFTGYDPRTLRLGLNYHSWGSSADKDGNGNINADTTLYAIAAHHQQILLRYREALDDLPALALWRDRIGAAQEEATAVLRQIETTLDQSGYLTQAEFDRLSAQLKAAIAPLDKKACIEALETQPPSAAVTSLLRHLEAFGFSFGTLEYRETAEEFERIVARLIPDYPAGEGARRNALNMALMDPAAIRGLAQRFEMLGRGAEGKPYSRADVAPIAYHTRKRLELARDFPNAISNQVLAECQNASNMLEILLLQHAVVDRRGARATLGIVPLFEDSDTLEKAPDVLRAALASPQYREHLDAVASRRDAQPAQQMQLAHSDNARRNGLPAARALIYRAHQQLRAAMDEVNAHSDSPVELQFYEGGSLSDPYRGGVRAISAAINEYGLHRFSKMTVQGGDLLNYFNLPDSNYRVLMRNITHNAARLEGHPANGVSREAPVIAALADSKDDYKKLFHGPEINDFLASVGFAEETKAGNTSSRAGQRANGGSEKLDVTKARTISFSEGFQHAGLTPTWIGSMPLAELLQQQGIPTGSPRALQQYYRGSPLFKDVIDRMLFGLVRTDIPYLRERSGDHPLMQRFEEEYSRAFKLCMEAYTGKSIDEFSGGMPLSPAQEHDMLIREVYPHVSDVFADQDRFTDIARHMKRQWLQGADSSLSMPMLLHNAMDTVLHGRLPLIDDPTYATLYSRTRNIVRPHGPGIGPHLAA